MLEMRQYANGETRVVDADNRTASQWLHHSELDAPLEDYNLDCDLGEDSEAGYRVVRSNA